MKKLREGWGGTRFKCEGYGGISACDSWGGLTIHGGGSAG